MNKLAQINIGEKFLGNGHFLTNLTGVGQLVTMLIQISLTIAGVVLLILMMAGGISLIAGSNNGNPEAAERGKKTITSAAIGFAVVFAAYWIVQLLESLTGFNSILQP